MSKSKDREKALKTRDKATKTWGKTKKDADHSDSDESDEKCVTTPEEKGREEEDLIPSSILRKMPIVKQR